MLLVWLIVVLLLLLVLAVVLLLWKKPNPPVCSTLVDPRIDLHYLSSFLTDEEADRLIQLAEGNFRRSGVIGPLGQDNYVDPNRTSSSCFLHDSDLLVRTVKARAARQLGVGKNQLEGLQVVKYEPGQFFNQHHDWFTPDYAKRVGGQREFTIFVYLTTGDGPTEFPKLGRAFQPRKGDALQWRNCTHPDRCQDLNLHRGAAPQSGVKYGLNIWSRF